MVLFCPEKKKQKGIIVYGKQEAVHQAVIELGIILQIKNRVRNEWIVPSAIVKFLRGSRFEKLRKQVKDVLPATDLFKISHEKLALYCSPKN